MTAADFEAGVLEMLRNYWRMKAANALYRGSAVIDSQRLDYANVPAVGFAVHQFAGEQTSHALAALHAYLVQGLPRDLFFALIARFEERLIGRLRVLGLRMSGTLGQLQVRIQTALPVPQHLREDLNEIRERRNSIVHHGGAASSVYVVAASVVSSRAAPFVRRVAQGESLLPNDQYLVYAADVLVRFSNSMG